MPRMENNGGDVLARGAASATFKPAGSHLSREKWDEIWGDFDAEKFKNAPTPKDPNAIKANASGGFAESAEPVVESENAETGSDSGVSTPGTPSVDVGEAVESHNPFYVDQDIPF